MGRKNKNKKEASNNKNYSKGQRRRRTAEKIRNRELPVYDKVTGEYHLLSEGEEMVKLFNLITLKEDRRYYVTSFGRIISLIGGTPHFLKQVPNKKDYLTFGEGKYVQRAVWFSFTYDAIKNKKELPYNYELPEDLNSSLSSLRKVAKESRKYEVHHMDGNPRNNHITNLECCTAGSHSMLHTFDRLQGETESDTDEKRLEFLQDRKDITAPAIISADDKLSIEKLSPENMVVLKKKIRPDVLANIVEDRVSRMYGAGFFKEDRVCVIDDGKNVYYYNMRDGEKPKRSEGIPPMSNHDILYDVSAGIISVTPIVK